jgi:hypothetical protein
VETRFVSYEELQRDKRADREEDARRLRLGLVTPEQLHAEYSLFPLDAEVRMIDFCETVNYRTGALSERAVVNLLEEIREIVTAPNAEKATRVWGFDFTAVWPMPNLRGAGEGKIARWLEHRLV